MANYKKITLTLCCFCIGILSNQISFAETAPQKSVQIYYAFPQFQRDLLSEKHCNTSNNIACKQKLTKAISECLKTTPPFTEDQKGKIAYYVRVHMCVDKKMEKSNPIPDDHIKTLQDMEKSRLHHDYCDNNPEKQKCYDQIDRIVDKHFQDNNHIYQKINQDDNEAKMQQQLDEKVKNAMKGEISPSKPSEPTE